MRLGSGAGRVHGAGGVLSAEVGHHVCEIKDSGFAVEGIWDEMVNLSEIYSFLVFFVFVFLRVEVWDRSCW